MFPQKYPTHEELLSLKPKTKPYKVGMGNSLSIYVRPNGKLYWRGKYRFEGKENTLSIGNYPEISISAAHEQMDHAKKMIKLGINPNGAFREEKRETREELRRRKVESMFKLDLSTDGGIIISRNEKTLSLTPEQTKALKTFLEISNSGGINE